MQYYNQDGPNPAQRADHPEKPVSRVEFAGRPPDQVAITHYEAMAAGAPKTRVGPRHEDGKCNESIRADPLAAAICIDRVLH